MPFRLRGEYTESVILKERSVNYVNNEPQEDWDSNDTKVYVEFLERHGKEGDTDGQILVVQDVRCRMRYRKELDPDVTAAPEANYRIKRGLTEYDIVSIKKVGRRTQLDILLTRRDNI